MLEGNDLMTLNSGTVIVDVIAGRGNDTIDARTSTASVALRGGEGDDILRGGSAADTIRFEVFGFRSGNAEHSGDEPLLIAGVSMARGTPNDRMVRSCTTPSPSTDSASEVTHPKAMWAAPIAYERNTTSSSRTCWRSSRAR